MSKFSIFESISVLQDEIRCNEKSRYNHRLHCLLLVAKGMSCREVAKLFEDSPRIIQYWVSYFELNGLQGLLEDDHPGRPSRLTHFQKDELNQILGRAPKEVGLSGDRWDGKLLSIHIKSKYNLSLGIRQCQRLLRNLNK